MLTKRGFTVVELVVVMVIMAILLVLAGLSLSKSQANARDTERKADIDVIARGIESRYIQGKLNNAVTPSSDFVKAGTYPGTDEMKHIIGQSVASFTPTQVTGGYGPVALPGTTVAAFSPPNLAGTYTGFTVASGTCAIENQTCIDGLVSKDVYYYEPIDESGTLCAQAGCVRFNLYWRYETGSDTSLQTYRSKHQ